MQQRYRLVAILPVFGVVCGVASCSVPGLGGPSPEEKQARKEFQAIYQQMDAANDQKNLAGLMSPCMPDYVVTTKDGRTYTLNQATRIVQLEFATWKSHKSRTEIEKVTVKGNTAVVVTHSHSTTTIYNPLFQRDVTRERESNSEDTWVRSGQQWKLHSEKEL